LQYPSDDRRYRFHQFAGQKKRRVRRPLTPDYFG
jgi:hypothetical protein